MTRRRRTSSPSPSPSPPRKRVAFEFPAPVPQFSTISCSLATTTTTTTTTPTPTPTFPQPRAHTSPRSSAPKHINRTHSQPRPASRSSSLSAPSPSATLRTAQNAIPKFVQQSRPLSDGQEWSRPGPKASAYSATTKVNVERTPPAPTPANVSPPVAAAALTATFATTPPAQRASTPKSGSATSEEPPLKPGESPNLHSHPNLIASLIARKRAENEAIGLRERLARKQAEYRMPMSPADQSMNELKTEVGRNEANQTHSRLISNPFPARGNARGPIVINTPTPIVFEATPALRVERVSTSAIEDLAKAAEPAKDPQLTDRDSHFRSPVSSPIAEFLGRTTDDAGLREALEPNPISAKTSTNVAPAPPEGETVKPLKSPTDAMNEPQQGTSISPLFSEMPLVNQTKSRSFTTKSAYTSFTIIQQPPQIGASDSIRASAAQPPGIAGKPQLAPRKPPMPPTLPYYSENLGMPGYCRIDFRGSYGGDRGSDSFVATSASVPVPAAQLGPSPIYEHQPPPPQMMYPVHPTSPMRPYMIPVRPPPGPIPTYGSTVTATAEQTKAWTQIQTKPSTSDRMTVVDMVAGINTIFEITTKNDFSIPKRRPDPVSLSSTGSIFPLRRG